MPAHVCTAPLMAKGRLVIVLGALIASGALWYLANHVGLGLENFLAGDLPEMIAARVSPRPFLLTTIAGLLMTSGAVLAAYGWWLIAQETTLNRAGQALLLVAALAAAASTVVLALDYNRALRVYIVSQKDVSPREPADEPPPEDLAPPEESAAPGAAPSPAETDPDQCGDLLQPPDGGLAPAADPNAGPAGADEPEADKVAVRVGQRNLLTTTDRTSVAFRLLLVVFGCWALAAALGVSRRVATRVPSRWLALWLLLAGAAPLGIALPAAVISQRHAADLYALAFSRALTHRADMVFHLGQLLALSSTALLSPLLLSLASLALALILRPQAAPQA